MGILLVENIKRLVPEALDDVGFKSGYAYAKETEWVYKLVGLNCIEKLALNYLILFQETDNTHLLGMAIYLLEMAAEHNKKEEVA